MKLPTFTCLLVILTFNTFIIMAQTDLKLNSRIEGKKLTITYQKSKKRGINEAVLFIHGASFPSALASGFRMGGISWADHLSKAGYDVFALDFLGYGKSDRYDYMSDNGDEFAHNSGGIDVVKDIDLTIDYIQDNFKVKKLHLIGHSWGATVSGHYATLYPEKIAKLVLFAPFVERKGPTNWNKATDFYTELTPMERVTQFVNALPEGEDTTLEDEIFTKWKHTWQESDPSSIERVPISVRFPSAWEKDLFDCWNGNCFFEPSKIQNPTLLIRGEWDTTLNIEDANKVFMEMKSTSTKRYVVIDKSTHVMHLEKQRFALYEEVQLFLNSK